MTTHYFTFLKNLTVAEDGLEKIHAPNVLSPKFQQLVNNTYSQFTPARYANNKIKRGVRWGILANAEITWTCKNTYQVSKELNPEEAGSVREIDQIPDTFLGSRVVRDLIDRTFHLYHPGASSHWQPSYTFLKVPLAQKVMVMRQTTRATTTASPITEKLF